MVTCVKIILKNIFHVTSILGNVTEVTGAKLDEGAGGGRLG